MLKRHKWEVVTDINGGEYEESVYFDAVGCKQTSKFSVEVDGREFVFSSPIVHIRMDNEIIMPFLKEVRIRIVGTD